MRREAPNPDDHDHGRGADWVERREGPGGIAILLILLAVLVLVFVLQNTDEADVDFLFWDAAVPLWIVIAITASLGFAGGWLAGALRRRRREASGH